MSPLQDEEKILDEKILTTGHSDDHLRVSVQTSVSHGEKERPSINASRPQWPALNAPNETGDDLSTADALRHTLNRSTTGVTAVQERGNESTQIPSEHRASVPEDAISAPDVFNPCPPSTVPECEPREKNCTQDQDDRNTYPEGGLRAWLVVFGSFSGMTASFGLLNSAGTFQAYLSTHQLAQESTSAIGWIFSIFAFLTFFCGVQIGPVFDAYGPRWLVFVGTVLLLGGLMGLAESTSKFGSFIYMIP